MSLRKKAVLFATALSIATPVLGQTQGVDCSIVGRIPTPLTQQATEIAATQERTALASLLLSQRTALEEIIAIYNEHGATAKAGSVTVALCTFEDAALGNQKDFHIHRENLTFRVQNAANDMASAGYEAQARAAYWAALTLYANTHEGQVTAQHVAEYIDTYAGSSSWTGQASRESRVAEKLIAGRDAINAILEGGPDAVTPENVRAIDVYNAAFYFNGKGVHDVNGAIYAPTLPALAQQAAQSEAVALG